MSSFFENKYFNSYYYANIIENILSKDIELIGFIGNFFEGDMILYISKPFKKHSALHVFIEHVIGQFFENDMDEYDQKYFKNGLYVDSVFLEYGLNDYTFKEFIGEKKEIAYTDVEMYHDELRMSGTLEELYEKISHEVFYLLFNNRKALLNFNYIVAEHMEINIAEIIDDEDKKLFNGKGFLKRVRIPEWAKTAVFFRDKGFCSFCFKNISSLINSENDRHYDHIIPLSKGGLNDISNLQLLCSECILKKGNYHIFTSNKYQSWY